MRGLYSQMNQLTFALCASGAKAYLEETVAAADSILAVHPDASVSLYTDLDVPVPNRIDKRLLRPHPDGYRQKIVSLISAPEERILFLDGDCRVIGKLDDFASLLDRFDLCVTHAPNRFTVQLDIPDAFPEFNTGVILLRKTFQVTSFLKHWLRKYDDFVELFKDMPSKDQPAFRMALWEAAGLKWLSPNLFIFTSEYNMRFRMESMVSHFVKILHGRGDYEKVKGLINGGPTLRYTKGPAPRVFSRDALASRAGRGLLRWRLWQRCISARLRGG